MHDGRGQSPPVLVIAADDPDDAHPWCPSPLAIALLVRLLRSVRDDPPDVLGRNDVIDRLKVSDPGWQPRVASPSSSGHEESEY